MKTDCDGVFVRLGDYEELQEQYESELRDKEALIVELSKKCGGFAEAVKNIRNRAHCGSYQQAEDMCNDALKKYE